MIWLALLASSAWLGYEIMPLFRVNNVHMFPRILCGWLLGSTLIGIYFYISSLIIPISAFNSLLATAGSFGISFLLHKKVQKTKIIAENNPFFIFYMLFVIGFSLKYLSKLYRNVPYTVSHVMAEFIDDEISFIYSVLSGCNRRRLNPFYFANPMMINSRFHGYPVPLLYTASCMTLGASYANASIFICFLNIVATAYSTYLFAKRYTQWPTMASMLFLFSGSWASYLYFKAYNRMDMNNDLVHQISAKHHSVWFQCITALLSMPKHASYAIALASYSILYSSSYLSSALAAIIPSSATSFATFCFLLGLPNQLLHIIPFLPTLIVRFIPFIYHYKPLYREAEMRGIFFAPMIIWFVALGPVFLVLLFFGWKISNDKFRQYVLATLSPFLILQFIREGRDHISNAIAITAVFLPIAMILFTELVRRFIQWPDDQEYKGSATFFASLTFAFLLVGGLIVSQRTIRSREVIFDRDDLALVEWINKLVPQNGIILVKSKLHHPALLTGRQLFLGDRPYLYSKGLQIEDQLDRSVLLANSSATPEIWRNNGVEYAISESGFQPAIKLSTLEKNNKYQLLKLE